MIVTESLATANVVLGTFFDGWIEKRKGGWYVCWNDRFRPDHVSKRWQCRGNDFYPVWHHKYPGGGTSSTALSQLIRWVSRKPVLPISTWRFWASETCRLLPAEAVDVLLAGGYPERVDCVLCGNRIAGGLDWWRLDGVSGPCCSWRSGCRQQRGRE